jgi:capsular exopolysaccharide synthesis family protein
MEEYGLPKSAAEQYGMSGGTGDALDLTGILQFLRRRRAMILGISIAIFAVATVLAFVLPKQYTATASLLLDRSKTNAVDAKDQVSQDQVLDSPAVDTAVQVLLSRDLAAKVVDNLANRSEAQVKALSTDAKAQRDQDIISLLKNLTVLRQGLTYAINVSYTSPDPSVSSRTANTVLQQYLLNQIGTQGAATEQASGWLAQKLNGLRSDVVTAEGAVQQYRSSHGLLEGTSANGTGLADQTLTQQEISGLNAQLAQARADSAEASAKLANAERQAAGGVNGDGVGADAASGSVIGQLRSQRAQITGQLADLTSRYGEKYPGLIALKEQLNDINTQISQESDRVISSLRSQASVAAQRVGSLEGSLGASRSNLASTSAASVKLAELERNADSSRQVYQSFLDRYRQTAAQQGLDISNDKIIAYAVPPLTASFPKKPLFMAAGLIAGIMFGVGVAFLFELLERGLRTSEDVERYLKLKALASIPDLSSTLRRRDQSREIWPPDYLAKAPLSRFTETFRSLLTSLSLSAGDGEGKVIALCSTLPGEGKTTSTICLARTAGMAGLKVLVVDCDLRRGELSKLLFGERKVGVVEVLSGQATVADAMLPDPTVKGVFYLSSLAGEPGAPDVLATNAIDTMFDQVRAAFDLVLIDTAPVLALAETRVIARKADSVVFIVRWAETAMQSARRAVVDLVDSGSNVAGVALSQVDVRKAARAGYGEAMYYSGMSKYYSSEATV